MLFRKPDGGLDRRPIPFATLQIEILLVPEGGQVWALHGNAFMRDTVVCCLVTWYQEYGYRPYSRRLLESVMAERIDGTPVQTPVWFAEEHGVLYVYTLANAGKVKRIGRNPRITLPLYHAQ